MKKLFVFIFFVSGFNAYSQIPDIKLNSAFYSFHHALVSVDTVIIKKMADDDLMYGHSNGWVETKSDILKKLSSGYLKYFGIKADSIEIKRKRNVAAVRFVGDFKVSLKGGETITFHLKVLELWVKKKRNWKLFARQAVK